MHIIAFVFYCCAAVSIVSAAMVITARNAVHSVLFLVLLFFSTAILLLLLGAEFFAMILVVVYVGAVAVLFLFVVMMLNIDFSSLKEGFSRYLPMGGLVGAILLIELSLVAGAWSFATEFPLSALESFDPFASGLEDNTRAIGLVLYTKHVYLFQLAGLILLAAMIAAIVLTVRHRSHVFRQNPAEQNARNPKDSVQLRKIDSGQGL